MIAKQVDISQQDGWKDYTNQYGTNEKHKNDKLFISVEFNSLVVAAYSCNNLLYKKWVRPGGSEGNRDSISRPRFKIEQESQSRVIVVG